MTAPASSKLTTPTNGLFVVVGFLVCVELASGVLQGFYTPIWTEVASHLGARVADVNWFEAAQLIVSALLVPFLARLGDLIGHRTVLLLATAVTAAGSWLLVVSPNFTTFLIGYALQGAYVVWLPLEIAIVYRRTAGRADQARLTRRAAAILVASLETAVIAAALTSGALSESLPVTAMLAIPAAVVTACFVAVWFGVEGTPPAHTGRFDLIGLAGLTVMLGLVMAGLILVRVQGALAVVPWILIAAGLVVAVPFARFERRQKEPLIDVDLLLSRQQLPLQLTAFLLGISVLGAQIPLSTFARAKPAEVGYGLGLSASGASVLIAVYVLSAVVGALLLPVATRIAGPRRALAGGAMLIAVGYALWVPLHGNAVEATLNMVVVGLGSGLLIAALPAAAADAAPADRTGFATGMTNATKTVGGAIASAVFAIALASTGTTSDPGIIDASTPTPLGGYVTVWSICSISGLLAAVALVVSRRREAARG